MRRNPKGSLHTNVEEDKEDDEEEDQDPPNVLGECQGRFRRAVDPPKVEDKIGVVPHDLSTDSDVVKRCALFDFPFSFSEFISYSDTFSLKGIIF